ncbi:MAG: glycosyltransferase [Deltaproteobacteria bacterium]|nr:glycosyltransferase [Deltaproteobacteria bacterium]
MKVVHLSTMDSDSGAAKAAVRIHTGLLENNIDSKMLVAKKLTHTREIYPPNKLREKIFGKLAQYCDEKINGLLRTQNTSMISPAYFGSPIVKRTLELNPDIIQLHWICQGFIRLESLKYFQKQRLVWRLPDMWAFSGGEHYVGDSLRYEQGYLKNNRPAGESGFDLNRWIWMRKQKHWKDLKSMTLVSPSRWLADCIRRSVLFKNHRIEFIPTGQNVEHFKPIDQNIARQILGLNPQKKYILFGSIDAIGDIRKGFHLLKPALQILSRKQQWNENLECLVFGSETRKNHGLDLPVKFLGYYKDDLSLMLAYNATDAFVAASTEENLANTVIESMACGKPVVAFRIGGMPDIIRHQENGFLAKDLSPQALADGIEFVIEDSERWIKLSTAAREIAIRLYSTKVQTQSYIDLYQDLIKR